MYNALVSVIILGLLVIIVLYQLQVENWRSGFHEMSSAAQKAIDLTKETAKLLRNTESELESSIKREKELHGILNTFLDEDKFSDSVIKAVKNKMKQEYDNTTNSQ